MPHIVETSGVALTDHVSSQNLLLDIYTVIYSDNLRLYSFPLFGTFTNLNVK